MHGDWQRFGRKARSHCVEIHFGLSESNTLAGDHLQKGDDMLRELENRTLAEAKGASGLKPSLEAMEDTMGRERDLILARWMPCFP